MAERRPACLGCGKPIGLDDDIQRVGDAMIHDKPECVVRLIAATHSGSLEAKEVERWQKQDPSR